MVFMVLLLVSVTLHSFQEHVSIDMASASTPAPTTPCNTPENESRDGVIACSTLITTTKDISTGSVDNYVSSTVTGKEFTRSVTSHNSDATTAVWGITTGQSYSKVTSTTQDFLNTETTTRRPPKDLDDIDVNDITDVDLDQHINEALNNEHVKSYIGNLTNHLQQVLVHESLQHCPFTDLCNISLGLNFDSLFFNTDSFEGFPRTPCCQKCFCGSECVFDGNCCPDAPWVFRLTEETGNEMPDDVHDMCIPRGIPDSGNKLNDRIERIHAITGCPVGTNVELMTKCVEEYETNTTASLIDVLFASHDKTGSVYRNRYCAICNGIGAQFITLWQPSLLCQFSSEEFLSTASILPQVLSGKSSCDISFQIPDYLETNIESCSRYVAVCNRTGLWQNYSEVTEKACSMYGLPIEVVDGNGYRMVFRNPFCAICNGIVPSRETVCRDSTEYKEIYLFSGLLRVEDKKEQKDESSIQCPTDSLYDQFRKVCRQVHCADGREYVDGRCLPVLHVRKRMEYGLTMDIRPVTGIHVQDAYRITHLFTRWVSDTVGSIMYPDHQCGSTVYLSGPMDIDTGLPNLKGALNSYTIQYMFTVYRLHNNTYLIENILRLNEAYLWYENENITMSDYISNTDRTLSDGLLFQIKIIHAKGSLFERVRDIQDVFIEEHAHSDNYSDTLLFALHNSIETDYNTTLIPYIPSDPVVHGCYIYKALNFLTLRSCSMFMISLAEMTWNTTRHGIVIEDPRVTLDDSEYSLMPGTDMNITHILICTDLYHEKFFLKGGANNSFDKIGFYVSVFCISVSIACLLISLLTYCFFNQLRTLPGKNNMALIICLLLAQGIYLVGNFGGFHSGTKLCKAIGVATHFCWLLALFWMQVCTFHMFTVLRNMRASASSSGNKIPCLYHMYCFICSLVFVGINVVVSMVTSDYSDIGYGLSTCYISTNNMVMFTFNIPVAVVVLSNISMFLTIVIQLKRAPTVMKNVRNERNYFLVFAKLSTVTGAAWLFGFLYLLTEIEALMYTFIVLNATQGVFIMLGFVCNKRTGILYRDQSSKLRSRVSGWKSSTRTTESSPVQ